MKHTIPAHLILSDGTRFSGRSFGAQHGTSGEVVFATGMVGYPEAFTDPSFQGQIVCMTYPMLGNYGVAASTFESEHGPHIQALIVQEYSEHYSHATAKESLGAWLTRHGIPAIEGVDTRALTHKLREHGVMLGQVVIDAERPLSYIEDPNARNLVAEVSVAEPRIYNPKSKKTVIAIDTGMKQSILTELVERGVRVKRVPWNYNYLNEEWDGIFLTNGPGDPKMCVETIRYLKEAMKRKKPIFGICLGSQIMGLASGAKTYKLRYGHRSQNQPCVDVKTGKCYLTTQNHGFAVDKKTLKKEWNVWFENANDGSVEGIHHKHLPFMSVQFHPESTPGPEDTRFLFDHFIDLVKRS
ncbi:MAG: glutamine-hydrolyzing carbamoyl-phosphate synthase small subunit [Candidatus Kerfeldbacteria bacterium]|nr:glutamine-hydrolyzing carbamoyl-phosphate synthase small subunit [Candidatus Kerfeldbacteria bacterium]